MPMGLLGALGPKYTANQLHVQGSMGTWYGYACWCKSVCLHTCAYACVRAHVSVFACCIYLCGYVVGVCVLCARMCM